MATSGAVYVTILAEPAHMSYALSHGFVCRRPGQPSSPAGRCHKARGASDADAAFSAAIALTALDDLVRAEPVWAGCWRARQALKGAQSAVRLVGRNEDEATLRDSVLLTAAGDDPGPAGRVLLAYKRLGSRKPAFSSKGATELADLRAWPGMTGWRRC